MRHLLTLNGKSMRDFALVISGEDSWKKPTPDVERLSIPGRNGDLVFSNHRYENVEIKYHAGITKDFDQNFTALSNYLLSLTGYQRLEDSYHPDVYRMALLESALVPETTAKNKEGQFDLIFSCKPQMFLKSGEQKVVLTGNGSIYNPTMFESKPLLRIYGTGLVGIGGETITITAADGYTDIDCDIEEAYKDTAAINCNGNIELSSDDFPVLVPGINQITLASGITKIEIVPRWWKI